VVAAKISQTDSLRHIVNLLPSEPANERLMNMKF